MAKTTGKSREQRKRTFFYSGNRKLGGTFINEEFIGGNWEFEVLWLFIRWVVTVSQWLGYSPGRRKSSFLLLGWYYRIENIFLLAKHDSSCLGQPRMSGTAWELLLQALPNPISVEVFFINFHSKQKERNKNHPTMSVFLCQQCQYFCEYVFSLINQISVHVYSKIVWYGMYSFINLIYEFILRMITIC